METTREQRERVQQEQIERATNKLLGRHGGTYFIHLPVDSRQIRDLVFDGWTASPDSDELSGRWRVWREGDTWECFAVTLSKIDVRASATSLYDLLQNLARTAFATLAIHYVPVSEPITTMVKVMARRLADRTGRYPL